jgi:glycosyltransferase involved in cell wall biosynthesis
MELSVIIPTHNPHAGRLRRTLAGLRAQTLAPDRWETVLVDNASTPPVEPPAGAETVPSDFRVVREPTLGLTAARRRGLGEARAPLVVLVDDDNVLAPDYLAQVIRLFAAHPRVGALGGRSLPEFERPPSGWEREFLDLLALRDLGDTPNISRGLRPPGAAQNEYPVASAPIGAGMALRRAAVQPWLDAGDGIGLSDRRGRELTSSGDNDIVLTVMARGWEVGYFPELSLVHLIPAGRLEPDYLARLNRGIQKSWMQVLTRHAANPWPPIPRWSLPLRCGKAWFTHRAWSGVAARIRWQGACGHFEGRTAA